MKLIIGLIDGLTERVLGRVDAGACVPEHGCCCKGTSHPHYILGCHGKCRYISTRTCTGPCDFG